MAKLTLTSSVGAIWLLIALFGLCLVQPIDCLENDEELFEKLSRMEVELVEVSLEQVEDADNVGLRGQSVARLLRFRESGGDCRLETLKKDNRDIGVYWSINNYNKGLQEFCQFYLTERVIECADELEKDLNLAIQKRLKPTELDILDDFYVLASSEDVDEDGQELMSFIEYIQLFHPSEEEIEEIEASCKRLHRALNRVLSTTRLWSEIEFKEKPWWIQVDHACTEFNI